MCPRGAGKLGVDLLTSGALQAGVILHLSPGRCHGHPREHVAHVHVEHHEAP